MWMPPSPNLALSWGRGVGAVLVAAQKGQSRRLFPSGPPVQRLCSCCASFSFPSACPWVPALCGGPVPGPACAPLPSVPLWSQQGGAPRLRFLCHTQSGATARISSSWSSAPAAVPSLQLSPSTRGVRTRGFHGDFEEPAAAARWPQSGFPTEIGRRTSRGRGQVHLCGRDTEAMGGRPAGACVPPGPGSRHGRAVRPSAARAGSALSAGVRHRVWRAARCPVSSRGALLLAVGETHVAAAVRNALCVCVCV